MTQRLNKYSDRIAIVGGTGFIGSQIVEEARHAGIACTVVKSPRLYVHNTPALGDGPPELDEALVAQVADQLRGYAVVINAAGISDAGQSSEDALVAANALLPLLLANASIRAGVRRFIHISSAAVQGRELLDETPRVAPFSPYSRSKALGEQWLSTVPRSDLEVSILRPTSVHGRGRRVTQQVIRLASGPFSSYAGTPRSTPQTLAVTVARSVLKVATYTGDAPRIVLTPDERLTTESFLRLVSGRRPKKVPEPLARLMVRAAEIAGRLHPRLASYARRLELLWFGQKRDRGWLDGDASILASPDAWRDLNASTSDRTVVFGVTTGHSVRPFFTGMHRFLTRQGWSVVLTCADEGNPREFAHQEGIQYRSIPATRRPHACNDVRTLLALVQLLRQVRPAIAVWGTPKIGLLGPLASWITRTPSIYVVHGLRLQTIRQPMLKAALRASEIVAMRAATGVVAVGNELKREIVSNRLAPSHRVVVLRHGSANGVPINETAIPTTRADKQIHFGFIGRVTPDKGIVELLDAWPTVRKEHPTARLTVAGALEVPSHDPITVRLKNLPGVTYLGHISDTNWLFNTLTALVLPSHREGLPTVVLEAAAHAVPSIVTTSTGTSEPVIPDHTGLVVPVGDSNALAAAMVQLACNPRAAFEMGLRARDHVRSRYAQEPLWRTWNAYLHAMCGHRRTR